MRHKRVHASTYEGVVKIEARSFFVIQICSFRWNDGKGFGRRLLIPSTVVVYLKKRFIASFCRRDNKFVKACVTSEWSHNLNNLSAEHIPTSTWRDSNFKFWLMIFEHRLILSWLCLWFFVRRFLRKAIKIIVLSITLDLWLENKRIYASITRVNREFVLIKNQIITARRVSPTTVHSL